MPKQVSVAIKLFDSSMPMPAYQSSGAAGIDLYAREEVNIEPKAVGYIPLNIALQLPEGYWAMLAARSSLHKSGLLLANGIGVGDYDYRGNDDEYKAALLNVTDQAVVVEKGQRIVQLLIMPATQVSLDLKVSFEGENRGGFGSTGK